MLLDQKVADLPAGLTLQEIGYKLGLPLTFFAFLAPAGIPEEAKKVRIRDVIGPGGREIRGIQDMSGAKFEVDDSGRVSIFAPDGAALRRAQAMVEELTQEAELGKLYTGKVKRITDFGAFVEIFPGTGGLVHISHLAEGRLEKVEDVVSEGDEILVKCIDIDPTGRIRLSRKEAVAEALAQGE